MVHGAAFVSMKDTLPLQAADMLAWETYAAGVGAPSSGSEPKYVPTWASAPARCSDFFKKKIWKKQVFYDRMRFHSGVPDVCENALICLRTAREAIPSQG